MEQIKKVKSMSIWIFIVPFIAVNACLILITQFHGFFPNQEDIIHFTFPYFDGGASISRTATLSFMVSIQTCNVFDLVSFNKVLAIQ